MKIHYKILFLLLFAATNLLNAQGGNTELSFTNRNTEKNLYIIMYPVSMVFNGAKVGEDNKFGYNLIARQKINSISPSYRSDFINALNISNGSKYPIIRMLNFYTPGGSNNYWGLQHDAENLIGSATSIFGYGKYRVDLWYDVSVLPNIETVPKESFTIDIDANYGIPNAQWYDLRINWYGPNDIKYSLGVCENIPLPSSRNIEVWNACPQQTRAKNLGDFRYDDGTIETPNPYTIIPIDPRRECTAEFLPGAPDQNHEFLRNDVGILTLNLTIAKNVSTPTASWSPEFPSFPPIVITNDATLKLAKGDNNNPRILNFREYIDYSDGTDLLIHTN